MLLWFILKAVRVVYAADYEVDGELAQTIFKMDGGIDSVTRSRFTVFVKDCSWLIQTIDLSEAGKPLRMRETSCTNNAEIYEVMSWVRSDNPAEARRLGSPQNVGSIISNDVPVGQDYGYFVCHLWLMFASGCYFENPATNWLTPVYDANASVTVDRKLAREAKWKLLKGPGSLPLSVVYLDSDKSTDAAYMATGVTNAGTIQIASGFLFELRVQRGFAAGQMRTGDSSQEYRIQKQAIANVTAVRPGCSRSDLLPAVNGSTLVIDQRQADVTNPIPANATYIVRDGVQWLSVEKAKELNASQKLVPKRSSTVTVVFYGSLLSISVVFLFVLSRLKARRM